MEDPNIQISNARNNARLNQRCTIDNWEYNENFKKVIEKFGKEHQINIFAEECGEALVAISKYRRGLAGSVAVVEELVDLSIMIEQLKLVYDPDKTEFDPIYEYKIDRIKNLLGQ
jgi:hypothetical protein